VACLVGAFPASAADGIENLKQLSLEELADLQVSITSKRPERLMDSASAVYVITAEDIRRSGYTTIAELMRLVPGMDVARIDTSEWAISSRGFNSRFANKLLVMIDGRSVYNSLFSGVYWEAVDTILEDIERIEVIRGPGASAWGANAVNGVVNIITRHAGDTQGGLVQARGGSRQSGASLRQGTRLGEEGYLRFYAKYDEQDLQERLPGGRDEDRFYSTHVGFRGDWEVTSDDDLMVQGEWFRANAQDPVMDGGNLMFTWENAGANGSVNSFQAYYSRFAMDSGGDLGRLDETEDTIDLEYRHQFVPMGAHELIAGVGYRWQRSEIQGGALVNAYPTVRDMDRFSAFFQDEITLLEDELFLVLGTKVEHNDYTGFELQPTVRASWHPRGDSVLWGSVSRAVRTPSRAERDLDAEAKALPPSPDTLGLPVNFRTLPVGYMESEELIAYEAGYRWQPSSSLGLDLALFYNRYDDLRTMELGKPQLARDPYPRWWVPVIAENRMQGHTWGLEVVGDWRPRDSWRLQAWYSLLRMTLRQDRDSTDPEALRPVGESPRHQAGFRAGMDLLPNLELDFFLRYVSSLPDFDVDGYVELDARLGWYPMRNLSFSLTGHNLLHPAHAEYGEEPILAATAHEIKRELLFKVELKY
jgi:iron complex outermembrane receptor protein